MPSYVLLTLRLIPISLLYFQPDLVLTININYTFQIYENYEIFAANPTKYVAHILNQEVF